MNTPQDGKTNKSPERLQRVIDCISGYKYIHAKILGGTVSVGNTERINIANKINKYTGAAALLIKSGVGDVDDILYFEQIQSGSDLPTFIEEASMEQLELASRRLLNILEIVGPKRAQELQIFVRQFIKKVVESTQFFISQTQKELAEQSGEFDAEFVKFNEIYRDSHPNIDELNLILRSMSQLRHKLAVFISEIELLTGIRNTWSINTQFKDLAELVDSINRLMTIQYRQYYDFVSRVSSLSKRIRNENERAKEREEEAKGLQIAQEATQSLIVLSQNPTLTDANKWDLIQKLRAFLAFSAFQQSILIEDYPREIPIDLSEKARSIVDEYERINKVQPLRVGDTYTGSQRAHLSSPWSEE